MFDPKKPVQTRDGNAARIICTNAKDKDYPIVALIANSAGDERVHTYTRQGHFRAGKHSPLDLVNIEQEHTVELKDGTVGTLDFYGDIDALIGTVVAVRLHDENGMPINAYGELVGEL